MTGTYVISNVERLSVIGSSGFVVLVVEARRDEDGEVSLPEANVDVEGGCKGRHFHVVSPLARLAHLLDMKLELPLQLLFGISRGLDGGGQGSGGLALGVSADVVHGHVLAVEARVLLHVLDGECAKDLVHVLGAVELIRKGIEQAVALGGQHGGASKVSTRDSPSPLISPAYKALASRMGNSGELDRDLRGAMMTVVFRRGRETGYVGEQGGKNSWQACGSWGVFRCKGGRDRNNEEPPRVRRVNMLLAVSEAQ